MIDMTYHKRSLQRSPGETWRQAEARLFRVILLMIRGDLPRLEDFDEEDRRRLGYLAEASVLLLGATNRRELLAYADQARPGTNAPGPGSSPPSPTPLVPGATPHRGPQMDELAAEWGFLPGLDVDRFRAEAPCLAHTGPPGPGL